MQLIHPKYVFPPKLSQKSRSGLYANAGYIPLSMVFFSLLFSGKIRLNISSESSAGQRINMKNQALFSLKDKSKKLKCRLLQFLFWALRVNSVWSLIKIDMFGRLFCN